MLASRGGVYKSKQRGVPGKTEWPNEWSDENIVTANQASLREPDFDPKRMGEKMPDIRWLDGAETWATERF